jgi:hypothetical protein
MITYLRAATAIGSVLVLAACAATTADVKSKGGASGAVAQNPACLSQTGSRINATDSYCSSIGRYYSREDINRTGATTAGEALTLLDPSITVHR